MVFISEYVDDTAKSLAINSIVSNGNIRKKKVDKTLDEYKQLRNSIKLLEGVLHSVIVYKNGDEYVLIDGHQRVAAYKDLKHEFIPARIINKPDRLTEMMYHANNYRVSMSLYEKVLTVKKVIANYTSIKDISVAFGFTMPHTRMLVELANLCDRLMHPDIIDEDRLEDIEGIVGFDIAYQDKCLDDYIKYYEIDPKNLHNEIMLDDFHWHWLRGGKPDQTLMELFTKKELSAYAEEYPVVLQSSLVLFDDLVYEDKDFLEYCLEQKYPNVMNALADMKVNENIKYEERHDLRLHKLVAYKDPVRFIKQYTAHNGNMDRLVFQKPIKKNDKIVEGTDPVDKLYVRVDTKFARAVGQKYLEDVIGEINNDSTLFMKVFSYQYIKDRVTLGSIDTWNNNVFMQGDKPTDKIRTKSTGKKLVGYDELVKDYCFVVTQGVLNYWLSVHASFDEVEKATGYNKEKTINFKNRILNYWRNNLIPREDMVNCFTTAQLQTCMVPHNGSLNGVTKKKADLVAFLVTLDEFPSELCGIFNKKKSDLFYKRIREVTDNSEILRYNL